MKTNEKISLEDFYEYFFQNVISGADAMEEYRAETFFDDFCEQLIDAGEFDSAQYNYYANENKGIRVDGYAGDPRESEGVLTLIVSSFKQGLELETLTATEMEKVFKRVRKYLELSLESEFRKSLEETSPGYGLSETISSLWGQIDKVRLILITNRVLSKRVDSKPADEFDGKPVTYNVWDIGRLATYVLSGEERENIVIDLNELPGGLSSVNCFWSLTTIVSAVSACPFPPTQGWSLFSL